MQESCQIALDYIKSNTNKFKIKDNHRYNHQNDGQYLLHIFLLTSCYLVDKLTSYLFS